MAKLSKPQPLNTWDIEDGLRTLQRAAAIQKDPKLMKAITSHHNSVSQILKTGGVVNKNTSTKVSLSKKK